MDRESWTPMMRLIQDLYDRQLATRRTKSLAAAPTKRKPMPRPICAEDFFEYHVKRILREAMDGAELDGWTAEQKADWLWENKEEVGKAFMDDVANWMGLEEAIKETEE